ncbi:MAG: efflux RND transporter permease subunit, partial [Holophagales bacterium]|nr:efflux RND transporter permease subunit [Holophagales bacterium]
MFLSNLSIKRPVFTTCVMLALVVLGLFSLSRLGVDLNPDVEFPFVTVSVVYPGASPDAVEQDVARKIEEAINPLEKLRSVSSTSMDSVGIIFAEFELEREADKAMDDVRSAVATIRRNLPETMQEPVIQKVDPSQTPVLSLVVRPQEKATGMTPKELTRIADEFLKRRLENVPGVGTVDLVGGAKREVGVKVDPRRMEALGITLSQIMGALGSDTLAVPSGNLRKDTREIALRVDAKAQQVTDFEHVVVGNLKGRPIELQEVADVIDGIEERRSMALLDGQNAVALELRRQKGGNTVEMVNNVISVLNRLGPELDEMGVEVFKAKDNSWFITDSVHDVAVAIILGGLITVLIVFYFLRSWRSTIITSLTLPVSIISSFIIMKTLGFTLNNMTLMALSLAVGILIDDAIVVRENITRHAEMGKDHVQAAIDGTDEIGQAVVSTTMSILAVFVPVAFMGGIAGRFFFSFGIVVAFAVAVSLFVSFTLDPMLSAVWPDPEHRQGHTVTRSVRHGFIMRSVDLFNEYMDRLENFYKTTIQWAMGHRKAVMTIAAVSFFVSIPLMGLLGNNFQPDFDRGELEVSFKTEPGAHLEATARKAAELERIIRTNPDGTPNPEIDFLYTTIGTGMMGTMNEGSVYVKLAEGKRRGHIDLRRDFRERLGRVPGVEIGVGQAGMGGQSSRSIAISILGPERKATEKSEPLVRAVFEKITGAVDIISSNDRGKPEIRLVIDRKRASDLGVSPMSVANVVRPMVDGVDVAKFEDLSGEQYNVRLRLSDQNRATVEQLGALTVTSTKKDQAGNNIMVKVANVASFEEGLAPARLQRSNLRSRVTLSSNMEGKTLTEITGELARGVAELQTRGSLPPGVTAEFDGMAKWT